MTSVAPPRPSAISGADDNQPGVASGDRWRVGHCITAGGRHHAGTFVKAAAHDFKSNRGSMVAASMAFYWFLAVFPSLLALIGVLGVVGLDGRLGSLVPKAIDAALPGSASTVLKDTLTDVSGKSGSSVIAILIGITLALWAGSAGMVALQRGLNVAYDLKTDRKFFKARLIGLGLLGATAILGGVATAAIVFGKPIGSGIREHIPLGAAFVPLWTIARYVIGIVALAALITLYYRVGPNRASPLPLACSPGSLVATVGWIVASVGFSFYVSSTGSYARTYGSFTGVVVLMLWLYLSAIAVVFGAEMNREWEADAARRAAPGGAPNPAAG